MSDFVVRWNDFRGGDYGLSDPSRAGDDQFSGRNVQVYRSGLLGPRAGFRQVNATGLPTHTIADGPVGFDANNENLVIVIGGLYRFPIKASASIAAAADAYTAYPSPASTHVGFVRGNGVLYSLNDGVLYKHNILNTTAVTTPEPLSQVIRWGYFMVGVDRDTPWRLWFSQVDASGSDFDTWPANNFLDVGNHTAITKLAPLYNTLFCGKAGGWWAVSGVLGELASVREVNIGNGPIDELSASVTSDNRVVYWPQQQAPAFFNGERVSIDESQRLDVRSLPFLSQTCIVTPTNRTLILAGDDPDSDGTDLLVHKNRAWFRHVTPFDLGALAPSDVQAAASLPDGVVFGVERASGIGATPVILSWQHDIDRPAHNDDAWAVPIDYSDTDLVTGTASMPAWFDGQGRQCLVRSVTVQFRKWPSGVANTINQLRVAVDALGPYGGGIETTEPEAWAEASDAAAAAGEPDSWRVNFGDQGWANGFQIRFPAIRGVAIQEVIAHVEIRKART